MREQEPAAPRQNGRLVILAAVALTACGLAAWTVVEMLTNPDATRPVSLADIVEPGDAAGYNVLLITLDTTRADRLGCYGYESAQTPSIGSLLDHGVRFDDAVASAPTTLASHATIHTGLYPHHHGVRVNGRYRLAPEHVTLADTLQAHGYETAAFVACFVLDQRFGLDQGFDVYDFEVSDEGRRSPTDLLSEREAHHVTTAAIKWLRARRESTGMAPFFLWVHYYDPHSPYESPLEKTLPLRNGSGGTAYDGEIAFVDLHLGRLLDTLTALGAYDHTLIGLVSDHGESLGEHGEQQHGGFLYEASMRVALMFSCPTVFERPWRVDDRVVGTVDIVPTIADLLGIPLSRSVDGLSLLTAEADSDRAIYMETLHTQEYLACSPLFGLRRHGDKFILAPRSEYYDLRRDPTELRNLYGSGDPRIDDLRRRLSARMEDRSTDCSATRTMSPEEVERLASLGYVDLGGPVRSNELPDPKDQVPLLAELDVAVQLMYEDELGKALAVAQQLVERMAGVETPVFILVDIYRKLGQEDEAIRVLTEFSEKHPSAATHVRLAELLLYQRRYDEMERSLHAAEVYDPQCGMIPVLRGNRFFDEQRYEEAVEQLRTAIRMDGERLGPRVKQKLAEAVRRMNANSL